MRLVSYNFRQGGLGRPDNPWLRVHCCGLRQVTKALFEVGGQYRRSM